MKETSYKWEYDLELKTYSVNKEWTSYLLGFWVSRNETDADGTCRVPCSTQKDGAVPSPCPLLQEALRPPDEGCD